MDQNLLSEIPFSCCFVYSDRSKTDPKLFDDPVIRYNRFAIIIQFYILSCDLLSNLYRLNKSKQTETKGKQKFARKSISNAIPGKIIQKIIKITDL